MFSVSSDQEEEVPTDRHFAQPEPDDQHLWSQEQDQGILPQPIQLQDTWTGRKSINLTSNFSITSSPTTINLCSAKLYCGALVFGSPFDALFRLKLFTAPMTQKKGEVLFTTLRCTYAALLLRL